MRKDKIENKIMRRVITWTMTVIIALSSIGGNFGVMTVYADELGTGEAPSEEAAPSATEVATSAVETATSAADTATEAASAATSAADTATEAVKDATTAVDNVKTAVEELKVVLDNIVVEEIAATESSVGTEERENTEGTNSTPITAGDKLEAYNTQVATDQGVIDSIDNLTEVKLENDTIIVGTVENENGTKTDVTLEDYVGEKAEIAEKKAEEAKIKLEEVLDIESKEVTQEIKDKVNEIKEIAKEAENAYNEANKAYNAATNQKDTAVNQYNLYAMAYGLPLYGYDDVNYSTEEAKAAVEAAGMTYQVDVKEDIENKLTEDQKNTIHTASEAVKTANTAVAMAELKVEDAQKAVDTANNAAQAAQEVIDEIEDNIEQEEITGFEGTLASANRNVELAQASIDEAQKTYTDAKNKLDVLKQQVAGGSFDSIALAALEAKIAAAEAAMEDADDELEKAKKAKEEAERCASWANALASVQETRIYVRVVDGDLVFTNDLDTSNSDVKSQQVSKFQEITMGNGQGVEVPYEVMHEYLVQQYKMTEGKFENIKNGTGISVGKILTETIEKEDGTIVQKVNTGDADTMTQLFWILNEDNKLQKDATPMTMEEMIKAAKDEAAKVKATKESENVSEEFKYEYTALLGYTFKHEKDGYHIDGVLYKIVITLPKEDNEEPEITVIPTDEENSNGGNPGGGNPGGGNPGGAGRTAGTAGDVLGAKREDIAMVAEEGDVLGATRAPKTSDSAKAILWMLVMGSSAIGAAAALASKRKDA